jgi:hypothetical protein
MHRKTIMRKYMKYLFLALFLLSNNSLAAPFPDLIKKEYKFESNDGAVETDQKSYVSYSKNYFKEINIQINSLEPTNPLFIDKEDYESPDLLLGIIDLSGNGDFYYMVLSWGASYDVSYVFFSVKKLKDFKRTKGVPVKPDFIVEGTSIIIPSNGNIYSYGHNNNLHSIKRKFVFVAGNLNELSQPFHYIGLQTTSLKEQTIFSDTKLTSELYKISKGSVVTIVGLQSISSSNSYEELYVVASEFGLVGYVKADYDQKETQFSGFFYAGD